MGDRTRNLLHKSQLDVFVIWATAHGYIRHPLSAHKYEVARLSLYTPSGDNPHLVFYARDKSDHITTTDDGTALVRKWLASRRKQ